MLVLKVRIWDIETETPMATLKGHTNWVLTVAWSPTADVLASAGMVSLHNFSFS